jgi:hypothetical protein
MKLFTFNPKTLGKLLIVPALVFITITSDSCKKESGIGATGPTPTVVNNNTSGSSDAQAKTDQVNTSISKALRDFVISGTITNTQSGVGSGSNTYSNVAVNITVTSTPSTNIYAWSDPTNGASFTLTQSTSSGSGGSGGGLGQLSYNGKTLDFNYVLCIEANSKNSTWGGLMGGRDLRGLIAIQGQVADTSFSIKNMAAFFVNAKGGDGKYDFVSWNSSSIKSGDAIGEILDFSAVATPTMASFSLAKILFTSNGSIEVKDKTFTLSSNAKVTDLLSSTEYDISGSISCE